MGYPSRVLGQGGVTFLGLKSMAKNFLYNFKSGRKENRPGYHINLPPPLIHLDGRREGPSSRHRSRKGPPVSYTHRRSITRLGTVMKWEGHGSPCIILSLEGHLYGTDFYI